jgi:hypothetical protein
VTISTDISSRSLVESTKTAMSIWRVLPGIILGSGRIIVSMEKDSSTSKMVASTREHSGKELLKVREDLFSIMDAFMKDKLGIV